MSKQALAALRALEDANSFHDIVFFRCTAKRQLREAGHHLMMAAPAKSTWSSWLVGGGGASDDNIRFCKRCGRGTKRSTWRAWSCQVCGCVEWLEPHKGVGKEAGIGATTPASPSDDPSERGWLDM